MKVYKQLSEDEIRRTYLDSNPVAERPWCSVNNLWCPLSEFRLLSKIIEMKPAGISRKFHLLQITDYMNNVYEDEDIDFEEMLGPHDFSILKKRKTGPKSDVVMAFKPKYRIRPTVEEVQRKIAETWNMQTVERNEGLPAAFEITSEFVLPDSEFAELLRRKEDGPPRKKARRGGSPDSETSRSSTPGQRY